MDSGETLGGGVGHQERTERCDALLSRSVEVHSPYFSADLLRTGIIE